MARSTLTAVAMIAVAISCGDTDALLAQDVRSRRVAPVLGQVTAARIVSAERALVLDASEGRVHLVDAEGRSITSIGRKGSGPREFRAPERIERLDNGSFAVLDRANGRLTQLQVEGDSLRIVGERAMSPNLYALCRAGRTLLGAVRGDSAQQRVSVLRESLEVVRSFGSVHPDLPPPVRSRLAESRLGCISEQQVIAAEYLGPLVTSYSLSGEEQWRTSLPNHRSIRILATERGTRFEYPRAGHHGTLEVLPLSPDRVAISLQLVFLGPPADTATLRGTVYELDARSGRVLSERTSPARLRDVVGALRLYDYEDPEPRVAIRRGAP
ncbi:MAG TPA: hypothetical protein PKE51_02060 [Gemmatimonadaceae bacterium]|nr:hypothetical protein [Gemmatimonadaceae bacterium]